MPRVSLQMIAHAAGVSRMTVSRALRGAAEVSPKTAEKIQKLADEMGYVKDPAISQMMQSFRSQEKPVYLETLGFVITHPEWIPEQQIETAKVTAETLGYRMDIIYSWEHGSPKAVARVLKARGIRGVLLAPNASSDYPSYDLPTDQLTTVLLGSSLVNQGLPRVKLDYYQAVSTLLDECFKRGYKRVGLCVDRSLNERTNRAFSAAFRVADHSRGISWAERGFYTFERYVDPGWKTWFEDLKPDAVILGQGNQYDQIRPYLNEIHTEVAAASIDPEFGPETLAGMMNNSSEVASTAVRVLVSWVRSRRYGHDPLASTIMIPGTWREGTSLPYRQ